MLELDASFRVEPRISDTELDALSALGMRVQRGRCVTAPPGAPCLVGFMSLNVTRQLLRRLIALGVTPTPRVDGGYVTQGTTRDGRVFTWANMMRQPAEVVQNGV